MLRVPEEKIKELVVGEGLMNAADFDTLSEETKRLGQRAEDALISRGIITQDYLDSFLSKYFNIPLANLTAESINRDVLKLIPESIAREKRVVLFNREADGTLDVALEDPSDLVALEFLRSYLKSQIRPFLATVDDLNKGFSLYGSAAAENYIKLIEENVRASLLSRAKGEEAAGEVPIVAIVDNIVSYALSLRASDIHLEVLEKDILVRYRIDGILHEMFKVPKDVYPAIVARVKLLGSLKIDEHYKPQDGRFRYKISEDIVDVRVSIIPTFYGEKIEMRLLPSTARPLSFAELGMMEDTVKILTENIQKSYGMVLVCGPTGSGKTTTLYSVISILNRPEVNIVTIEDPIEYNMKYINQIQVNTAAGITFADGLRSILRQDPNIIMVGEMRDAETATTGVQSALTGHLVLSSLHTNDAPTAVPRLMDMNIEPYLVSAVLNTVLAQRLVRKIHLGCIESYEPSEQEVKAVQSQIKAAGLDPVKYLVPKRLYRGKGCAADNFTGYSGRVGIFEIMDISEKIREHIVSPKFSLDSLRALAAEEGMISMFQDGLRKAELGITTIDEVLRVIGE
ncbi:MAG: GspE/PulE family protein [Patescibacteria group bacterium]|nr:GspE/PulE family protein [Patescibacteria group bacterium]MDE2144600.1 type II/IV secretion system protein [Patescibacteria group bacterium]